MDVYQKTWKWPQVEVAFFVDGQLLVHGTLVKVRDTWVSMPHFNLHSFIVSDSRKKSLKQIHPDLPWNSEWILTKVFIYLSRIHDFIISSEERSQRDDIRLSIDEWRMLDEPSSLPPKNKIFIRGKEQLSNYCYQHKTISELNLKGSLQAQFLSFSSSVRRKIRKAQKNEIIIHKGGIEYLESFYDVYRKNIHRLGSFGLPMKYFENMIHSAGGDKIVVFIAVLKSKTIGGGILIRNEQYAENLWFASDKKYNKYYTTYLLHYAMIRWAIDHECTIYSMGRSTKGGNVEKYKRQWGVMEFPLYYNFSFPKSDSSFLQKMANRIIPLIPLRLVKQFDSIVARYFY